MRSSQWFLIGISLIVMGILFIQMDNVWRGSCSNLPDSASLNTVVYSCINGEILDPFIWLLHLLGIVFIICGSIESRAEKKNE